MTIKFGINGFGRIDRCTLSHIAASARNDIEVIKVNATDPLKTSAHLLPPFHSEVQHLQVVKRAV